MIRFRDINDGRANFNVRTVSKLLISFNQSKKSIIISDLKKNTEYEFYLVPFQKIILGRPSNTVRVKTMEDLPTAPPTSINTVMINLTSVCISWMPPPTQHRERVN